MPFYDYICSDPLQYISSIDWIIYYTVSIMDPLRYTVTVLVVKFRWFGWFSLLLITRTGLKKKKDKATLTGGELTDWITLTEDKVAKTHHETRCRQYGRCWKDEEHLRSGFKDQNQQLQSMWTSAGRNISPTEMQSGRTGSIQVLASWRHALPKQYRLLSHKHTHTHTPFDRCYNLSSSALSLI